MKPAGPSGLVYDVTCGCGQSFRAYCREVLSEAARLHRLEGCDRGMSRVRFRHSEGVRAEAREILRSLREQFENRTVDV